LKSRESGEVIHSSRIFSQYHFQTIIFHLKFLEFGEFEFLDVWVGAA